MASPFQTKAPFAKLAAAASAPKTDPPVPHRLSSSGVEVFEWAITHTRGPMLNSSEVDLLSEKLNLPSLPEMVFGKNAFILHHKTSGFRLEFNAEDALAMVSHTPPTDVKVAASDVWSESNRGQVEKIQAENAQFVENATTQDFDWTFTTHYCGTTTRTDPSNPSASTPYTPTIDLRDEKAGIPMEKLRSTSEPILWFSHVHLFEDELHDNGIAEISTKSRVMNTFWFVLVRFWLRVDGVLFRVIDHRLYHEFGSNYIIREKTIKQGTWEEVNSTVKGDLRKVKDPNDFASHLHTLSSTVEHVILPQAL